jgi:Flp pilus assembly protein TadD
MLGRPEVAVEAFERAVELNPNFVGAHLNRAITLNDLGRLEQAREAFARAAEIDGEQGFGSFSSAVSARLATLHAELGDAYAAAGALPEATEQLRRACEIRPQFLDIRNRFARALIEFGEVDAAQRELRSVLDANPAFAAARANLGLALYRSGDVDAARAEWERCATQHPGNPQVDAYLAMLRRLPAGGLFITPGPHEGETRRRPPG